MSTRLSIVTAAALILANGLASAQSFNIELGSGAGATAGAPSGSFAAAGQPGHWNAITSSSPASIQLRNLSNVQTSVTLVRPTGQNAAAPISNADSGEFRLLMGDGIPVNPTTNQDNYVFSGLQPGRYMVYVYFTNAPTGNDAGAGVLPGLGQPMLVKNGGNANKFRSGGNYTVDLADVSANGQMTVRAFRTNAGQANVAGIQLVKLDGGRKLVYVNDNATGDNSGTSWANAMTTLIEPLAVAESLYSYQTAISDDLVAMDLWVAGGMYHATYNTTPFNNTRTDSLRLYDGIQIRGGFAGTEATPAQRTFGPASETIITGEIGGPGLDDNTYTLLELFDHSEATLIEHVTLTKGYDQRTTTGFRDGRGGAVIASGPSGQHQGPVFKGVKFVNNTAYREGGAVYATSTSLKFIDCQFISNSAKIPGNPDANGGAYYGHNSDPVFIGCDFFANQAANRGGAVYSAWGGGTTHFVNSRIIGNQASGGTVYMHRGPSRFSNTLIASNSGAFSTGAAIVAFDASADVRLENSTVANNSGISSSAGVLLWNGPDVYAYNSLLWGNTAGMVEPGFAGEQHIKISNGPSFGYFAFSSIQNGDQMQLPFNTNNIYDNNMSNPLFANPAGPDGILGTLDDDYTPSPNSPAIDTADLSFAPADHFDLDNNGIVFETIPYDLMGNARIRDIDGAGKSGANTIDRGAIEVQPLPCLGDIADDFGFTLADGGGPDGTVDFGDFVALLGLIGPCSGGTPGCLGDIADDFGFTLADGGGPDGTVDFGDFVALLGLIGPCD